MSVKIKSATEEWRKVVKFKDLQVGEAFYLRGLVEDWVYIKTPSYWVSVWNSNTQEMDSVYRSAIALYGQKDLVDIGSDADCVVLDLDITYAEQKKDD